MFDEIEPNLDALCWSCRKLIYPNYFCSVKEKWIGKGYPYCKSFEDEDEDWTEEELAEFMIV